MQRHICRAAQFRRGVEQGILYLGKDLDALQTRRVEHVTHCCLQVTSLHQTCSTMFNCRLCTVCASEGAVHKSLMSADRLMPCLYDQSIS